MNYCSMDFEWEPESEEELNRVITHDDNILKVLEKGEQILSSEIARIVNYAMYENGCFCEVKIKGESWGHSRYSQVAVRMGERFKDRKFFHKKHWRIVYFYTKDIMLIQSLIQEVSDIFFELDIHGFEPYEGNYKNKFFKIGVSYERLLPFLLDSMKSLVSSNYEFKDEWFRG